MANFACLLRAFLQGNNVSIIVFFHLLPTQSYCFHPNLIGRFPNQLITFKRKRVQAMDTVPLCPQIYGKFQTEVMHLHDAGYRCRMTGVEVATCWREAVQKKSNCLDLNIPFIKKLWFDTKQLKDFHIKHINISHPSIHLSGLTASDEEAMELHTMRRPEILEVRVPRFGVCWDLGDWTNAILMPCWKGTIFCRMMMLDSWPGSSICFGYEMLVLFLWNRTHRFQRPSCFLQRWCPNVFTALSLSLTCLLSIFGGDRRRRPAGGMEYTEQNQGNIWIQNFQTFLFGTHITTSSS